MSKAQFQIMLALATGMTVACTPINQRYYYRSAIEKFAPKVSPSTAKCWVSPDLVGGGTGSSAIAEEEFTTFLIEKNICHVVEKHPDATGDYKWPEKDVCPCAANQTMCATGACTPAGGGASAVPSFGGLGGGGGAEGNDNNRSGDKLLERHKKSTLPQKFILYRIDEMNSKKSVIHFRVSDAQNVWVEQSGTVTIFPPAAAAPAGE